MLVEINSMFQLSGNRSCQADSILNQHQDLWLRVAQKREKRYTKHTMAFVSSLV